MYSRKRSADPFAALLGGLLMVFASGCAPSTSAPPAGPEPEEEVKVGYGTQDRDDVTGSISSLTEEDLEDVRARDMGELLEGRVPGLQVFHGPNGPSLRIRGVRSFMGSNEPLVVVDGVPLSRVGISTSLRMMNPQDIERVDVLKDAASTAIYGSRGANGVILITTRRPE